MIKLAQLQDLQNLLTLNLSKANYTETKKLIVSLTSRKISLKIRYLQFKDISPLIIPFELDQFDIVHISGHKDYVPKPLEGATHHQRLCNNMEFETKKVWKGVSISFQNVYDLILKEKQKVLDINTPLEITMDDVLKEAIMMGCPDGAIHDIMKPTNRGVVTYSVTLCSRLRTEKLGIKLSSRR